MDEKSKRFEYNKKWREANPEKAKALAKTGKQTIMTLSKVCSLFFNLVFKIIFF